MPSGLHLRTLKESSAWGGQSTFQKVELVEVFGGFEGDHDLLQVNGHEKSPPSEMQGGGVKWVSPIYVSKQGMSIKFRNIVFYD